LLACVCCSREYHVTFCSATRVIRYHIDIIQVSWERLQSRRINDRTL